MLLLAASCVFYAAWDWRFLSLLFFSIILDYKCAKGIHTASSPGRKKLFLALSVTGNLGALGCFKYYDFFVSSLRSLLGHIGISFSPPLLNISIPLGISFYTFQTMSYTFDVYRGLIRPACRFSDFALFVSFFPQLVAGPIERSKHLLPQITAPRRITASCLGEGGYLILWGLFLKVVAADNLSKVVDPVFASSPPYRGIVALLAAYAFTFQIFCDFYGYSTIARGIGKCMGFDIMANFRLPFFVTNARDFWDRWHISLSSWVRDYLYFPLLNSLRKIRGEARVYIAIFISMLLVGLWHGAAWTYVLFGIYWGVAFIVYILLRSYCHNWLLFKKPFLRKAWFCLRSLVFFHCVVLSMLIFRSQSPGQFGGMLRGILYNFNAAALSDNFDGIRITAAAVLPVLLMQVIEFRNGDEYAVLRWKWWQQGLVYFAIIFGIVTFGNGGNKFIYFQF